MSKVKSAIITAIFVAAVIVAALFAVISFPVAGSGGVERINSIFSDVNFGGELTGEAYTVLYPEGVIPASQYNPPEAPAQGDEDYEEKLKKHDDYIAKYTRDGNFYVESDLITTEEDKSDFKKSVSEDAKLISKRFEEKDYLSCTVSVEDGYAIRISTPTDFSYSAYNDDGYSSDTGSAQVTRISTAIRYLTLEGELSLRNSGSNLHPNDDGAGIVTSINQDVRTFFKSISVRSSSGVYMLRVRLTKTGYSELTKIVDKINADEAYSDKNIVFYVGENSLLTLSVEGGLPGKSFVLTVSDPSSSNYNEDTAKETAENYAAVLNSVIGGETLTNGYNKDNSAEIVYATPSLGKHAVIYFGVALLAVILAAAFLPVIKYKKLGLVHALSVFIFSLVMLYAVRLIGITVTIAGGMTFILGLALLSFANFRAFEAVRAETLKGKTMQASVKSGYRSVLTTNLDLHILLLLACIILALVPLGEAAACGFIFFIATVASYALHWFTRFMWFVISSPVRDKFAFGGYKREVTDDDE